METDKKSKLGFVLPIAGQLHQEYLKRRYEGLTDINKKMITLWLQKNGWKKYDKDVIILSSKQIFNRALNKCYKNLSTMSPQSVEYHKHVPYFPVGWKRKFKKAIASEEITSLLINYGGCGVALLEELEKLKIPVAVTFEGSDAQVGDYNRPFARQLKRLWERCDMCIFVSRFLREQAIARGCPPEKSVVIHNGTIIPEELPGRDYSSTLRVICVGNFLPVKGHEFLLKAFALAHENNRNLALTLVGTGPLESKLKQMARELEIEKLVDFTGALSWWHVQFELRQSHIYVQPSVQADDGSEEGLSCATIEAQAVGLPAIVFDSGGLPETIKNGYTGFVVEQKNINAMANGIIQLSKNIKLNARMSELAFQWAKQNFDIRKQNAIWKKTVANLMEKEKYVSGKKTEDQFSLAQ